MNRITGGRPLGPGEKELVEVEGFSLVGGPHFAPAGDKEDPHAGVIDTAAAELPVVHTHHRGEARQTRHHFGKEPRRAGRLRGAAEPELIPPQDGGAAYPGHHDGRGVIGQDGGHRPVGGFARNQRHLQRHGAQMRNRHIHFHGDRGAGSADIFPLRGHEVGPPLLQTIRQLLQYFQAQGNCIRHRERYPSSANLDPA